MVANGPLHDWSARLLLVQTTSTTMANTDTQCQGSSVAIGESCLSISVSLLPEDRQRWWICPCRGRAYRPSGDSIPWAWRPERGKRLPTVANCSCSSSWRWGSGPCSWRPASRRPVDTAALRTPAKIDEKQQRNDEWKCSGSDWWADKTTAY